MLRVRFHGRGGQGAKIASRVLGTAAFLEGYHVQDFPLYGAERRGAPVAAFTRMSKEPLMERGVIYSPDIVIVMDQTLLPLALTGLHSGSRIFINTSYSPAEAKDKCRTSAQVITLDLTKTSFEMIGAAVISALAGGVASRMSGLSRNSLKDSLEREMPETGIDKELLSSNIDASLFCYDAIVPPEIKELEVIREEGSPVFDVPFESALVSSPTIKALANTPLRKTGNWRIFRPVWDYSICKKCATCFINCPDACIAVDKDGYPHTDYDNCKGCLICLEECPVKAIGKEPESHVS